MSLDVVNNTGTFDNETGLGGLASHLAFAKWKDFPISRISHHGQLCCDIARQWSKSMDFSQLNGGSIFSGPRWINARYSWGPTKWPIFWCEAVHKKSLDCGAQSALAHEVFSMRGVSSFSVQLVQKFSQESTRQWTERWHSDQTPTFWIDGNMIYHECCAIETNGGQVKIWDGTASCWVNSKQFDGYGSVLAVRICDQSADSKVFSWGEHRIISNRWQDLAG